MSRAIAGAVLAAWLWSVMHAQSAADAKPAEAKLEFEVASIKPSAQPGRGVFRLDPKGGPGRGDPRPRHLHLHHDPKSDGERLWRKALPSLEGFRISRLN